jgi:tetratricopeptide (TPR) repeat protein
LESASEALKCYEKAIQLATESSIRWNNRGDSLYLLNNSFQALESFNRTLELSPAHIPQVQPPKLTIFPDNNSLQNRGESTTLFLARVIFPHNYISIISKDVFACMDHILFISINIYQYCAHIMS